MCFVKPTFRKRGFNIFAITEMDEFLGNEEVVLGAQTAGKTRARTVEPTL